MSFQVSDRSGSPVNTPLWDPGYRLGAIGATLAATPTDFITLAGAAGVVVRVKSIKLNGVATANGNMPVQLIRRSAVDTGGTSTTPTLVKMDTNDAAASAVLTLYTANPTVGTAVGTLASTRINFSTTATGSVVANQGWDFTWRGDKPIVLRGATDLLAINFNGAAVPAGGLLDWEIAWEEGSN